MLELGLLLICEHGLNRVHVVGKSGDGQQIPALAAGHVMQTAVLAGRFVEADPAGEMRDGLRARPVRVVLMPRDYSAMLRWLAEKLVVPEAHSAIEQLRCRHCESRIPQHIMETSCDAPRSERVKEN